VLQGILERRPGPLILPRLSRPPGAAQFALARRARSLRVEAAPFEPAGELVEMKLQFLVELRIAPPAADRREDLRYPFAHGFPLFVRLQDAVDDAGRAHPLVGFAAELAPPRGGQRIEPGAPVVVRGADARLDPAALLEAQQCRIERALVERQQRLRDLLDSMGD